MYSLLNSQGGAEDLRMKMERQLQSPLASSAPPTPTTPVAPYGSNKVPIGLEGTIAPADMLNVLSAHRESVNTADGKNLSTKRSRMKIVLFD